MAQGNRQPNLLIKWLGNAALAGIIAIAGFLLAIYSTRSEDKSWQQQLDSQATQIANQRIQIELNAEQNRLLSERATVDAQEANIEGKLRTPFPSSDGDFALTATAIFVQSSQFEATRQAIEIRQRQIEATQTAIAQPTSVREIIVRASDITPLIKGEDEELQRIVSWWREEDYGGVGGSFNPVSSRSNEKCFGMVWNTQEYGYHRLIVFQRPSTFSFADGGWYVKICVPVEIMISPDDVGKIQADWLGKRYGIDNTPWVVIVN